MKKPITLYGILVKDSSGYFLYDNMNDNPLFENKADADTALTEATPSDGDKIVGVVSVHFSGESQ